MNYNNIEYADCSLAELSAIRISKMCKVETIQRKHKKLKGSILLANIEDEYHIAENVHASKFRNFVEKESIVTHTKHEIALLIDAALLFECYASENGLLSYNKLTKKELVKVCRTFGIPFK